MNYRVNTCLVVSGYYCQSCQQVTSLPHCRRALPVPENVTLFAKSGSFSPLFVLRGELLFLSERTLAKSVAATLTARHHVDPRCPKDLLTVPALLQPLRFDSNHCGPQVVFRGIDQAVVADKQHNRDLRPWSRNCVGPFAPEFGREMSAKTLPVFCCTHNNPLVLLAHINREARDLRDLVNAFAQILLGAGCFRNKFLHLFPAAARVYRVDVVNQRLQFVFASILCPVLSENDNAEQMRRVWRPLQKIARDCDAAMLVNHHIGKRSEDSQTPERVYRGRGASASGGAARAVWLLIPDPVTPGLSTLSCVKAKGESPADVRLQLDPATRWVRTLEAAPPQPTPLEILVATVTKAMPTAEIVAALKDRLKGRAVKDYLAEAVEQGLIRKVKHGVYGPESAESAESAKDENAQSAQSAQSKKPKVQKVHAP
jgi:hypothetical protein